ncbi:helix-turn-helix domain-containing protein [Acutalibacter muris]|uniref:helix-turn-helix domain-containing protein n=1 Tax=Acutalibacter muris TaxID=1796620 RepID=UPI00272E798C|nr:helix-turn-helix transcriptional regulator [Acutalibacter muris]
MSFYERLIDLIEKKSLTIRKVERECGLANASIRRWETQSPRLDSVVSVANYLQVSVDYLALGRCDKTTKEMKKLNLEAAKREQGLICDGSPLDNLEADLIAMFRLLPEEEREDIFDIVHLKYKRRIERKRESIYWTYFDGSDEESGPAEGREARDGTA